MATLNIRRTHRANDLFGACSDDDLMSWGQALVEADPFFDDEFGSTFPDKATVVAEPVLEKKPVRASGRNASAARAIESVLAIGARRALSRRR